ncbi:MAG TPA: WXG100 family type VII secretion target [Anaerolineae bacterium]|nr:WXG100 family type VII secretion target [Anaerolineae bacterium]HIP73575.1 WXG100 family type VII secretion target [Anaerolineae bacterium]
MTDEIRMDYGLMEDMSKTFQMSVEQLQDTLSAMQNVANELEDGALLGRGGDAFTEAIRNKLSPAISRLIEKFQELAEDVNKAMEDMRSADTSTERMY